MTIFAPLATGHHVGRGEEGVEGIAFATLIGHRGRSKSAEMLFNVTEFYTNLCLCTCLC